MQTAEKTSSKYREWLVALADCSKAVVAARTEEAAAKERTQAAESDLQLFLREADDVLGTTGPSASQGRAHRGHRRRRDRAGGEGEAQVCGACAGLGVVRKGG